MTHTQTSERATRAPNGCSESLRFACTPSERARVLALADREQRSASATVRLLIARGFESLERDAANAAAPSLTS